MNLRLLIRSILKESTDPWERAIIQSEAWGNESVRKFVERHGLTVRNGMIILYHAIPKSTKMIGDVIRAGSYFASKPDKAVHFAGRDRELPPSKVICYEVPLRPEELEWCGHYQTNSDIPLERATIVGGLNESLSPVLQGKTIVCVDIQPEYASYFGFEVSEWTRFLNRASKNNNIVLLFNGPSLGMVSEGDYQTWLMENGLKEDTLHYIRFIDKGYAFFRYCMDEEINEDVIVDFVKFMMANSINDSRDITSELWDQFIEQHPHQEIRDLLEHADDMISIPDLMDDLSGLSNIMLTGGGVNECLKEVEIALKALGKPYGMVEEFTY